MVGKKFGLSVGSIMRHYSVWSNLHPAAIEELLALGDVDYKTVCQEYGISVTDEMLDKFYEVDVCNRTAFYPSVWNKDSQSEELQVKCVKKFLIRHLSRTPPKALNLGEVKSCISVVQRGILAHEKLLQIIDDAKGAVNTGVLTETDATSVLQGCKRLIEQNEKGQLDDQLNLGGKYPAACIQDMAGRLTAIKSIAWKRKQDQIARARAAEEVCYSYCIP
jgi:hypothetical protein